jgi:hypothetical protein
MTHADTLLKFCKKIGIEESRIKEAESLIDFHLVVDSNVKNLRSISKSEIDHLLEIFGQSLTLKIGDAPLLFEIKNGIENPSFENALKNTSKFSETLGIRIEIIINKSIILDQLHAQMDAYNRIFYIFINNLTKFLKSSLIDLDSQLIRKPCQPVVIVVSESEIYYKGPFLTIIGVNEYSSNKYELEHSDKKWLEWINKYHKVSFHNLSWIGFKFNNITPIHFYCKRITGEIDSIDLILIKQMLNLCIVYTANRTSWDNDSFHASFSSSERSVILEFKSQNNILDSQFDAEKFAHQQNLLLKLALWPFGDKGTDRLVIFQNVVAREFGDDNEKNNYNNFIKFLPRLLDEAKWHHRIFMDVQIESHFEQMKELTHYIAEVTKEISSTFDSMTKGLTDSLLATIAVVIIALLTSLAKNDINYIIFKNILQIYAIYLLLFQGLYRMGSIWHSYYLLKKEIENKFVSYIPIFGNKRIDALSASLINRRDQFVIWFSLTSIVYISAIVFIWILANELPKYLPDIINST